MGGEEVTAFLTHLATEKKVASSTQNQALNAISFPFKVVLDRPLGPIGGVVRAKTKKRLPSAPAPQPPGTLVVLHHRREPMTG